MKRWFATLALAGVLVFAGAVAASAAGSDISDASYLSVGSSVNDEIGSAGNGNDVWRVDLTEGQEVLIRVEPAGDALGSARVRLLAPGVSTIYNAEDWQLVGGTMTNRTYVDTIVSDNFTPAKSGTYYIWLAQESASTGYRVSVTRTTSPAITTPDAGDIPGVAIGSGALRGVVEALTDPDDVYAVKLFANEPVTVTLAHTNNVTGNGAYLNVLDPSSTTVANYAGWDHATDANGDEVPYENAWAFSSLPDEVATISFVPAKTARYYLWVESSSIKGGFPYELTVTGHAEVPSTATELLEFTPSVSPSSVSYNGYVTVKTTLRTSGGALAKNRTLQLYKSTDQADWTLVGDVYSTSGYYAKSVQIKRKTYFRWSNVGDELFAEGESAVVSATSKASLTTPTLKSKQHFYTTYTAQGYLKPHHDGSSGSTRAYWYAKKGGRWVSLGWTSATVSDYGTYSAYAAKCRWTGRGTWSCRVRMRHADTDHKTTYSGWKYFTVH